MRAPITTVKKHNFSAGPAILPAAVIRQAAEAAADFNGMGLSILEISHRSPEFTAVMNEAVALVKELLHLSDDYAVLFLTGGASSQFFMSAMNLLDKDQTACFVDTGTWSAKAIKEAKKFGQVNVLASSKDDKYSFIPKGYDIPADARYLHLTSNNTVSGTQYQQWPETDLPFVCDMSSDIFSRPIDVNRFGLIYAGAQKNLGPAGTTLVIVKKEMLGQVSRDIPTMLNYQTHIDKNSSFNTPPVYPIYVCMLTMRWIKALGGIEAIARINEDKATLIYDEIDRNPLFKGNVAKEDRSRMNATFVMERPELEAAFLEAATEAGCVGIKGHRSVGGFRASIYNAMSKESIQLLVDLMQNFAQKNA
ncbi:MAG: 3-phosphoserine/phosphohydroxythreonine transaminase [Bacteroidota bacterium]